MYKIDRSQRYYMKYKFLANFIKLWYGRRRYIYLARIERLIGGKSHCKLQTDNIFAKMKSKNLTIKQ